MKKYLRTTPECFGKLFGLVKDDITNSFVGIGFVKVQIPI